VPKRTICGQIDAEESEDNVKKAYICILNRITALLIVTAVLFVLSGCTGLPVDPRRETEVLSEDAAKAPEEISEPGKEEQEVSEEPSGSEISEESHEAAKESNEEESSEESPFKDMHLKLTVTDPGYDVYSPPSWLSHDYKYGPSIINRGGGCIDAWFASPGNSSTEYDHITYMHSADGGESWSGSKVVLCPTPDSMDRLSVCDPDVFYYDGYYYMGYTSTIDRKEKGLCNSLFLARSQNPDGPYEKWNGEGWGGNPVPVVYFDGIELGWGVGEPSFVVLDDIIYVYSTKDGYSGVPERVRVTEVRTGDLKDPLWPARLSMKGYAVVRHDISDDRDYVYDDSDSWDVVYLEESRKFVALSTNRRFKSDSCLLYYESDDGISFERVSEINTNVIAGCHNSGIMGDGCGHIKKGDPVLLGYAYSGSRNPGWGIWSTRFVKASIDYTDEIDRQEDGRENLKIPLKFNVPITPGVPLMIRTDKLVYQVQADEKPIDIAYRTRDNYRSEKPVDKSEIKFEKYDPEILRISDDNRLVPIAEGMSVISIEYRGLRRDICVCVLPQGCRASELKSFYPACKSYDIGVRDPYVIKVRPMAVFNNYDLHELSNTEIISYGVTFRSSDRSVCTVSGDGTVVPVSTGDAVITVNSGTGIGYSIDVHVRESD
jgi:hypothetical protein